MSREPHRSVPDPLTSYGPFTLVWRGHAVLATRGEGRWKLRRGRSELIGPPVVLLERWSETVRRLSEWLDQHPDS